MNSTAPVVARSIVVRTWQWWMGAAALVIILLWGAATAHAAGPAVGPTCSSMVTVASTGDSGAGTLRQALLDVCTGGTVNFASGMTIPLAAELAITRSVTISNGTGVSVTVSGNNAVRVFNVTAGPVTLSGLDIISGTVTGSISAGGGVYVRSGVAVTVTHCVLRGNSAGQAGGGLGNYGSAAVISSTLSGNTAVYGGGLDNGGVLRIVNSTLSGNSAGWGGGVFNLGGMATIVNSTLSGNTARGFGGGLYNYWGGTATMVNSTLSGNSAPGGGGVVNDAGRWLATNTVVAYSTGGDCWGELTAGSHNWIQDGTCGPTWSGDPLLASLADNGGGTWTAALLPGSGALGVGDPAVCAADPVNGVDQRGVARPAGACDLGAFQSRGFTLTDLTGAPQSAVVNTAFAAPLGLTVVSAAGEPVGPGGVVTFTAPGSGPSVSPAASTVTTTAGGLVSRTVTANGVVGGPYTVMAVALGAASPVSYTLTNLCVPAVTVTATADAGTGTLRQALLDVCPGGTVDFAGGMTITLASELEISRSVTISNGTGVSVTVSGNNAVRVFNVTAGPVTLSGLDIVSGTVTGSDYGGGVYVASGAAVTVTQCAVRGNSAADNGGGLYSAGTLRIVDSTLSGNTATRGGGLYNYSGGAAAVDHSTVSGNTANYFGGGLYNYVGGTMTVTGSTLSGNRAMVAGGGGGVFSGGTLRIVNSTLSGNSAPSGGGVFNATGNATVVNSTIVSNTASPGAGGGLRRSTGTLAMTNTIVAYSAGGDLNGILAVNHDNWIQDGSGGPAWSGDPLLAPPAPNGNGGGTWTAALLPGSGAIDAGDAGVCAADPVNGVDQRGIARPAGACDLGAFESRGFTLANLTGTPQSAVIHTEFAQPLGLTVVSAAGEPVGPGGVISFNAPGSGPSLDTIAFAATTTAGGEVSRTVTANDAIGGPYAVTATAAGLVGEARFELNNLFPLSLSKTASPESDVAHGGEVTYTVALTNSGATDVDGAVLSDTLPGEVTFARWVEQGGASLTGGRIDWGGTVAAGQGVTVSFVVSQSAAYGATVTNTARYAHDASGGAGHADAAFTMIGAPVLALAYEVHPATQALIHGRVTYTLAVSNTGPADAWGVAVTDTLPVSATWAGWIVQPDGAVYEPGAPGSLTWQGMVSAGAAVSLTFQMTNTAGFEESVTSAARADHAASEQHLPAEATYVVQRVLVQYCPDIVKRAPLSLP